MGWALPSFIYLHKPSARAGIILLVVSSSRYKSTTHVPSRFIWGSTPEQLNEPSGWRHAIEFRDGEGAVQSISRKQKLNSKSSTESELVGADDVSIMILWTKLFLEEQGKRS
jgi:hypothetical protein